MLALARHKTRLLNVVAPIRGLTERPSTRYACRTSSECRQVNSAKRQTTKGLGLARDLVRRPTTEAEGHHRNRKMQ